LIALGLAAGLMGLFIVLAILNSERRAARLRASLGRVDVESFRLADQFRDSVRELNNELLNYGTDHDPAVAAEFQKESLRLSGWIDGQKTQLNSTEEKEVLQEIESSYADYLRATQNFQNAVKSSGQRGVLLADFAPVRKQAQRLLDLGQSLAKTHYQSRDQLVAEANQTLTQLRLSALVSLALLFLFCVGLAAMVYRDMIAPLHEKLEESQNLVERQEKLASLGMLAAGVAHEIRNPLTALKAALFVHQKKFQPGSPERTDVELVEREILRLERIVNDFLQFARPTEPELSVIAAYQPLFEVRSFFAPQLARANIELAMEPAPPVHVLADAEQIKQALINLVRNASESIGRNGRITLRARRDRKYLPNGEADVVILEVEDTGKGILPEVEKRLFDPFFTTKETGTGLGLPIAARIVEKHGGVLQYQTWVNRGTVFGIVLAEVTA
jgi:signal transduction histidine kinase